MLLTPQYIKNTHTNSCTYFKFIFHRSFNLDLNYWISISKGFIFATGSFLLFFPPWHKSIIFLWHLLKLISFNLLLPLPNVINIQYSTPENRFKKIYCFLHSSPSYSTVITLYSQSLFLLHTSTLWPVQAKTARHWSKNETGYINPHLVQCTYCMKF